jgi:hypothetical protein
MMGGMVAPSIGYSQAHTSATLAAQANSSATVSVRCTRSQLVSGIVVMAGTSSDSGSGVSGILFSGIKDSLRTHGRSAWAANWAGSALTRL